MPIGWGGGVWLQELLVRQRGQALVPGWRQGRWSPGLVLPQQPGSESGQGLCVHSLPLAREAGVHSLFCLWFRRQYTAGLRNIWEVLSSVFWGRLIELASSLFFS